MQNNTQNQFKHYPYPPNMGEKFEQIKNRIKASIDAHFMAEGKQLNAPHELSDEKLEEAVIEGLYTHFLSEHYNDIEKQEVLKDKEMLEGLIKQLKGDKDWKEKRETGENRNNISKDDKILDEVEMYSLYFKQPPNDKDKKTLAGYEEFLKSKLGDSEFAKSKQGYMAIATQKELETNREEFVAQNKDKYIEHLRSIFKPEKGQYYTSAQILQASTELRLSGLDLGIKLERGPNNSLGALIFQVRTNEGWKEFGRMEAEPEKETAGTGTMQKQNNAEVDNIMHAPEKKRDEHGNEIEQQPKQQTSGTHIGVNVVNKTKQQKTAQLARELLGIQYSPEAEFKYDIDYPPLSADMREVFCKGLYDARELLAQRGEQEYEAQVGTTN